MKTLHCMTLMQFLTISAVQARFTLIIRLQSFISRMGIPPNVKLNDGTILPKLAFGTGMALNLCSDLGSYQNPLHLISRDVSMLYSML